MRAASEGWICSNSKLFARSWESRLGILSEGFVPPQLEMERAFFR